MRKKNGLCFILSVCMLLAYRPAVQAQTVKGDQDQNLIFSEDVEAVQIQMKEKDPNATLAPYFFIEGADPTVDHLPLKGTEVKTNINGTIADTYVIQTYANEGENPINASYVFPASTKASVHGMKMEIGNQVVTAVIKEKEEAKQEYEEAKSEGKSASLLEEKRSNVFTMDVANIMPGDTIRIELHYTELIESSEGIYQFVFPTVVGPRYAGMVDPEEAEEGDWVESPYFEEGVSPDSSYDIAVHLSTGVPITDISCTTHEIQTAYPEASEADITLTNAEEYAGDRDFILNYQMTGEEVSSGLMLYEGEEENYFLLTMQPPKRYEPDELLPREYIFVLDVSGSMSGYPLDTAKELIGEMVTNLRDTDCFNLFLFSDVVSEMSLESVAATKENMDCANALIDMQEGGGGTELAAALKRVLATPKQPEVSRNVVVITDGYIYDEEEVFELIGENLDNSSFFSFGIGSSVNRSLMEGIADVGMGEAFIVTEEEEAKETADRFRTYIEAPILSGIQVDFGEFEVYDTEPSAFSTLFAQKPVLVFGKWRGEPKGTIRITGKSGKEDYVQEIEVSDTEPSKDHEAIGYLWARRRINTLTVYGYARDDEKTKEEITAIGLAHHMVTPYTSFVAVLDTIRNPNGDSTDVDQPSPLPRGVSGLSVGGYLTGAEPEELLLYVIAALVMSFGIFRTKRKKTHEIS